MTTQLTRREFLKLGGKVFALAALPSLPLPPEDQIALDKEAQSTWQPSLHNQRPRPNLPLPPDDLAVRRTAGWGRVTNWRSWVHSEPDPDAPHTGKRRRDDIVTILGEVEGVGHYGHNNVWYKIVGGYIYSSWVQPVDYRFNTPITQVEEPGLLAWVTVPYAEARYRPDPELRRSYRLYYDAIFRVVRVHVDEENEQVWYGVRDGLTWGGIYWVKGEHLRIVPPEEMTPISPEVEEKQILIELSTHQLVCLEDNQEVFSTRLASGMRGMATPQGTHRVLRKAHTTRMIGGSGSNAYDLPGIGFVSYFTPSGVAVHGTYWHNDYGRPRSHGCVNVSTIASQWVYRWTQPKVPYEKQRIVASAKDATIVQVVY